MDCCGECTVPMHKGKGDTCECSISSSISLLSVVGKQYGRVQIQRVRVGMDCPIEKEQCGLKKGGRCMEQVFANFCEHS